MTAEILCVGTEILLGDIVNTNAQYIAKELALIGIDVYRQSVVGDNPDRLRESLALALSRADTVLMTGGLGPTYDDLTKETTAAYFGRKMEMHEPSLRQIEEFYARTGRTMTPNNRKQAMMPERAVVFPNSCGTAPGLAIEGEGEQAGKTAIMMPGPPREMKAMMRESVLPYLMKQSDHTLVSRNVHIFGLGESLVEDKLHDLMEELRNPTLAPYAKDGEVLLRVTASVRDKAEADALIDPVVEKIRAVIGDAIYGIDEGNLQNALVQTLRRKHLTVATAESCTAGLVASRIAEIPGASEVFGYGVTTYANEAKMKLLGVAEETLRAHGAVSAETACEMASGVRALAGADIGVSVTGIAGPDGGSAEKPVGLVYVGVATEAGVHAVKLNLARNYRTGMRQYIRYVASSNALFQALRSAESAQPIACGDHKPQ